jgi:sulfhydrogenase subunit alpha
MTPNRRTLSVGALTRVEGEGALHITLDDHGVKDVALNIYEPPRFFEAFLRGRAFTELPDLTARICGICPVAYQVSACNAVESAAGVTIDPQLVNLRRLMYCGEWIHSHALHIYLLHAPDFLGHPDIVSMARKHRLAVERGLALKRAGNTVMALVGGRAVHPVNLRIGGFYAVPDRSDVLLLTEELKRALEDAVATARWVSQFDFPDMEIDHEFLALRSPHGYAIESGVIVRSHGTPFTAETFTDHVVESQVPYSTALHATLDGGRYLTGPLARYSLNSVALSPTARAVAAEAGLSETCRNPFRSIVVRAVEVVYAVEEALRLAAAYEAPSAPFHEVPAPSRTCHGVSEAPRGLLYHRYEIAPDGLVRAARIIPPTSQNQAAIEHDLRSLVNGNTRLDDQAITALCERAVRNHDPCISCATHFLTVKVDRW